jgi:hypothetical protein
MFEIDDTLKTILVIYLSICILLYQMKLETMFSKDGTFKPFGTGKGKTIYPYWLVTLTIGLIIYIYMRKNK